MRTLRFLPIESVISDIYRDCGIDDIHESDMIEWISNAVEHLMTRRSLVVSTCFLEVKNYECEQPDHSVEILRIAKNRFAKKKSDIHGKLFFRSKCKECDGGYEYSPVNFHGANWGWYVPAYWYHNNHDPSFMWIGVGTSRNDFFNLGKDENMACSFIDQYRVSDGKILFSFKEGVVAVSYLSISVDKNGIVLIPDDVSARTAITNYVIYKYMQRQWYNGREGYEKKMAYAQNEWMTYCKQFKNKTKMPSEEDYRSIVWSELDPMQRFTKEFWGHFRLCDNIVTEDCIPDYADKVVMSQEEMFVTNQTEGDTTGLTVNMLKNDAEKYPVFVEGSAALENRDEKLFKKNESI